jgi:hypothetical protein
LLATVSAHQTFIQKFAQQKPQPENFSRLTSSIMQAIEGKPAATPVFSRLLEGLFPRYAMAALSLGLIAFFFVEQQTAAPAQQVVRASSATVTLNTSAIFKRVRETRNEKTTTSLYACVKNGDCISTFSKTLN